MGFLKSFLLDKPCFFITIETKKNKPFFKNFKSAGLVVDAIYSARRKKRFLLIAFVVLHDHAHILLSPNRVKDIPSIIDDIKNINKELLLKNIGTKESLWDNKYQAREIKDEDNFRASINYIYNDPVEAGIVKTPDDYPFSTYNGKFEVDIKV